ncbi:MAG: tRNA (guanine(10)-N(2))-dimethyltransferase [Candidatus Nezhaarchaeota archaeon]|nr:tRNA (guanine(10)-N(2))-dimethyltransferase [Candidatus Nezhaarchaeota archaeon]
MYIKIPLKLFYEGKVKLLLPDDRLLGEKEVKRLVFYNPIMSFSRDFSICVLKAYARLKGRKCLRIAEPLTASGVRGIRYAKEVEEVARAVLSDINPIAVRIARINAVLNQVHDKVVVKLSNANTLLSKYDAKGKRFDFVDIDPFGSPSPYVDSAIRSTLIGGIVALTATDMPPLCGVYPHVALRRYGGLSLRTEYCHELAVRLILGLLAREAGKYELSIKPLIAHSTRHYIRVFVELSSSKDAVKNMGYVYHCQKCLNRLIVRLEDFSSIKAECEKCSSKMGVAGPLWIGSIFDKAFCEEVFKVAEDLAMPSKRELSKILRLIVSEADGPPTFYTIDAISHKYKLKQPKMWHLIETLRSHGFYASPTHFNFKGFRFNGDITELIKVLA